MTKDFNHFEFNVPPLACRTGRESRNWMPAYAGKTKRNLDACVEDFLILSHRRLRSSLH
jgi:hypothetical protein